MVDAWKKKATFCVGGARCSRTRKLSKLYATEVKFYPEDPGIVGGQALWKTLPAGKVDINVTLEDMAPTLKDPCHLAVAVHEQNPQ